MSKRLFLLCGFITMGLSACATQLKDPSLYASYSCEELRDLQITFKAIERTQTAKDRVYAGSRFPKSSTSTNVQYQGVNAIQHNRDSQNSLNYNPRKDLREKNKLSQIIDRPKKISNHKSARAAYRQNGCKAVN